ncbi:MAG: hypothetical protein ACJATA_001848 [Sphingobacteriales bacterium]|jgi:hypothetical protein
MRLLLPKFILASIIATSILGCSPHKLSIDDFRMIEGTWKSNDDSGVFEYWRFDSAQNRILGTSFYIANSDTQILEELYLFTEKNMFWLAAEVPENDDLTFFTLTQNDNEGWVFQNLDHDFPTHIKYHVKKETLSASVWNTERVIDFSMEKVD